MLCRQKIVRSFPEIRLVQIRAFIHRPVIHAANLQWQSIRLRRHQQIRPQAAKFPRQTVADIQRHAKRAVVTAIPTANAAAASKIRRGFRTKDSPTRRANIQTTLNSLACHKKYS